MVELKNAFAKEFKRCLIQKYGKVPSASAIAKDFTLVSPPGVEPISVETVRKWLLGINLPHSARMRTLSNWLEFDDSALDVTINQKNSSKKLSQYGSRSGNEILELINSFGALTASEKETVLHLINMFKESRMRA